MCDNMAAVTEEQAKHFFHQGPEPEVPASLKIREDRPPAVYAVKVRGEVVNYSVQFYFYTGTNVQPPSIGASIASGSPRGFSPQKRKQTPPSTERSTST